jgi:ABC-type transport system involved in multi-copper enzyme maturation permease subunit
VAILLVAYEYRFNTIMYTLTSINSRSKVLLAKVVALTSFTLVYMVVGIGLGVAAMYLGLGIKDITLIHQHVNWGDIVWRVLFFSLGYVMLGFILGLLFRSVVGAIITIFILPSTAEPLLGLLLKENAKYLPISSLERVISPGADSAAGLSAGAAAGVFGVYLAAMALVAWVMFVKRDAN